MRVVMVFVVGLMVGAVMQVPFAQTQTQNQNQVVMMNHVGIRVPDIEEAVNYYTQKMGYKVAFRGLNPQGGTQLVYLYISQNTFLELGAAGDQPAGFTHYGLQVQNAQKAVDMFRMRGVKAEDVRKSGPTGAMLSNLTDPYMGRIELVEYTPESLHGKAVASWKP